MVKNNSDRERGNPLSPHRLLFPISSKGSLNASSDRQANTYQGLCYNSRGALAGTRNSSMGPPWGIDPTTYRTLLSERSYHEATSRSLIQRCQSLVRHAAVLCCIVPRNGLQLGAVRAFANGAMDHRIDPSWWTHRCYFSIRTVPRDWCNKGCGMWYPVCGTMHINEPLLLTRCRSGFPLSLCLSCSLPYVWRHITVNKMCWVRR